MKGKQHVSRQPKGQKGQSRFHDHNMYVFFQLWVKQLIFGKQSKKETKYFISVPTL